MSIEEQNKEVKRLESNTTDLVIRFKEVQSLLTEKNKRIIDLETGLIELKSQLMDHGFNEKSIIIISINELKNK
jgi:anti-sigma regulatory factor (Ser/Thr protein kinase)